MQRMTYASSIHHPPAEREGRALRPGKGRLRNVRSTLPEGA